MATVFTTLRQGLQTAARTVAPFSGAQSQVVLGNSDWASGTNLFANIVSTGPWLFILPAAPGQASGKEFNAQFNVKADLLYGFANDTTYTWAASDDIIANLVKAWTTYSKWVSGNNQGPLDIEWAEPEVRSDLKPIVARTQFTFTMAYVADQV